MKRASITGLAESDLAKIWAYIARHDVEAADRFVEKLRRQCQKLVAMPDMGRLRPDLAEHIRSYKVGNYLIFYFVTETGIEVARVPHGARDLPRLF